jgi:hypothetical protein
MRWIIWGVLFCGQLWHPLEKITYTGWFWTQIWHFSKKKGWNGLDCLLQHFYHWDWHYSILYLCYCNLVSPFITYLFLLKDLVRNKNNSSSLFYFLLFPFFFCGFSTQFTTIISKNSKLSNEKKKLREFIVSWSCLARCIKNSFLHFKCYNLAIYEVKYFENFSKYSFSNLKQDSTVQSSQRKKKSNFLSAIEMVVLECFCET